MIYLTLWCIVIYYKGKGIYRSSLKTPHYTTSPYPDPSKAQGTTPPNPEGRNLAADLCKLTWSLVASRPASTRRPPPGGRTDPSRSTPCRSSAPSAISEQVNTPRIVLITIIILQCNSLALFKTLCMVWLRTTSVVCSTHFCDLGNQYAPRMLTTHS